YHLGPETAARSISTGDWFYVIGQTGYGQNYIQVAFRGGKIGRKFVSLSASSCSRFSKSETPYPQANRKFLQVLWPVSLNLVLISLVAADLVNTKPFDHLLSIVSKHYNPKAFTFAQQFKFNTNVEKGSRTHCRFCTGITGPYIALRHGNLREDMLTDRLVVVTSEAVDYSIGKSGRSIIGQITILVLSLWRPSYSPEGLPAHGPNLLGRYWPHQSSILYYTLNQVSTIPEVQSLIRNYEEVFSEPKSSKFYRREVEYKLFNGNTAAFPE
ncbi:hypothetical protein CSKR_203510, partial [Clonorchis sinensis]